MSHPPPLVSYVTGLGEVLSKITCSHILIISQNVFYSHEVPTPDSMNTQMTHSYTVFRKYWGTFRQLTNKTTFDRDWLDDTLNRTGLSYKLKVTPAEQKIFGHPHGTLYAKKSCVQAILLFAEAFYTTTLQALDIQLEHHTIAHSFGYMYILEGFMLTLPILYVELPGSKNFDNLPAIDWVHQHYIHGVNSHLVGILNCSASLMLITGHSIHRCKPLYFCKYCLPSAQTISLKSSQSAVLFNHSLFAAFVAHGYKPKVWLHLDKLDTNLNPSNLFLTPKGSVRKLSQIVQYLLIDKTAENGTTFVENAVAQESQCLGIRNAPEILSEVPIINNLRRSVNYAIVSREGINFITCYSNSYTSLKFYVLPFAINLWLGIGATALLLCAFGYTAIPSVKLRWGNGFSPLLYMYRCLVENGPQMPELVERFGTAKVVFGSWLLFSVIAANGYKGIVTNWIVAPSPVSTNLRTFNDILPEPNLLEKEDDKDIPNEIQLYAEIEDSWKNIWAQMQGLDKPRNLYHVAELMQLVNVFKIQTYFRNILMDKQIIEMITDDDFYEKSKKYVDTRFFDYRIYTVPSNKGVFKDSYMAAVESDLVQCGKKNIFVAQTTQIKHEFQYLTRQYVGKTFFLGEKELNTKPVAWQFTHPRGSSLPQIFIRFLENGIYGRLKSVTENWRYSGYRLSFTRKNSYKYISNTGSLASNLKTLFYISGSCILICLLEAALETLYGNRKIVWQGLIFLHANIRKTLVSWYAVVVFK